MKEHHTKVQHSFGLGTLSSGTETAEGVCVCAYERERGLRDGLQIFSFHTHLILGSLVEGVPQVKNFDQHRQTSALFPFMPLYAPFYSVSASFSLSHSLSFLLFLSSVPLP